MWKLPRLSWAARVTVSIGGFICLKALYVCLRVGTRSLAGRISDAYARRPNVPVGMDTNPSGPPEVWGKTLSSQNDPSSDIEDEPVCLFVCDCGVLYIWYTSVSAVYMFISSFGHSEKSEFNKTHLLTCRVSLPEEPPSAPPQNVIASGRTNQSIMIQWQPPPESHQNGILRGYVIRWDMSTSYPRSSSVF